MVGHEVLASVVAVVFDLDDTLFDHTGSTRRALEEWLQTLDAAATPRLVAQWFDVEARHFEAWRAGVISFQEQRRRRLRDFLPLIGHAVGTDAELDSVFAGYLRCYEQSLHWLTTAVNTHPCSRSTVDLRASCDTVQLA